MTCYHFPRNYVAQRLLEHGPLRQCEFLEITGWSKHQAELTLQQLLDQKLVVKVKNSHRKRLAYALASLNTADGFMAGTKTMPLKPLPDTSMTCLG